MLAHDLRFERPVTITRDVHLDRADIGDHGLCARAVTRVATVAALDGMLAMADVAVHLALQPGLKHTLREVTKETAPARKCHPLGLGPLDELRIKHTRRARRVVPRVRASARTIRHVERERVQDQSVVHAIVLEDLLA